MVKLVNELQVKLGIDIDIVPSYRCTGRSTGQAFEIIAKALLHPGEEILVRDHHDTREADKELFRKVLHLIELNQLKLFVINSRRLSVTFKLYTRRYG